MRTFLIFTMPAVLLAGSTESRPILTVKGVVEKDTYEAKALKAAGKAILHLKFMVGYLDEKTGEEVKSEINYVKEWEGTVTDTKSGPTVSFSVPVSPTLDYWMKSRVERVKDKKTTFQGFEGEIAAPVESGGTPQWYHFGRWIAATPVEGYSVDMIVKAIKEQPGLTLDVHWRGGYKEKENNTLEYSAIYGSQNKTLYVDFDPDTED